jgi:hypothetical protein
MRSMTRSPDAQELGRNQTALETALETPPLSSPSSVPMVDLGEGSTFARLCLVVAGDFAGEGDEPTERPKPKSGYVQPTLAAHNCGYHRNPGAPSIWAMVHDLPT